MAWLVSLFTVSSKGMMARPSSGSLRALDALEAKVISRQRANNVSILMAHLKIKPPNVDAQTCGILSAMLRGGLGTEQLGILLQVLPTDEESKAMLAFAGSAAGPASLSPPEQFMHTLSSRVARVRIKVVISMFLLQLEERLGDLGEAFGLIEGACGQVLGCEELVRVFGVVLEVGNALNDGTHRGNAPGFRIDTLSKLYDLKIVSAKSRAAREGDAGGEADAALRTVRSCLDFVAHVHCTRLGRADGEGAGARAGAGAGSGGSQALSQQLYMLKSARTRSLSETVEVVDSIGAGIEQARAEAERIASEAGKDGVDERAGALGDDLRAFGAALTDGLAAATEGFDGLLRSRDAAVELVEKTMAYVGEGAGDAAGSASSSSAAARIEDVLDILWRFACEFDAAAAKVSLSS